MLWEWVSGRLDVELSEAVPTYFIKIKSKSVLS